MVDKELLYLQARSWLVAKEQADVFLRPPQKLVKRLFLYSTLI
jgi:hypothetical protein